jgi:nucleoside-diphosphate-sugar epimerase
VLPGFVAGPDFGPEPSTSTGSWLTQLFEGERNGAAVAFLITGNPLVDIRDIAALHVAALLDTRTEGQRLWGFPHKVNLNEILATWRAAFPDKTITEDFASAARPRITVDESQSDRLIAGWQGGWTDWKATVVENVKSA